MKKILLLLVLLISAHGFAQINFEKGYFINNQGVRTECLIKNIAWKNAPVDFEYKLNETDAAKRAVIKDVAEFSVADAYTFKRYTVNIDRSQSNSTDNMSENPQPVWVKETLFLKVLVEGKATLYQYEDNNLIKYFFSTKDHSTAEQLLYREFKAAGTIKENNTFRQQLYNLMKDENTPVSKFENVKYKKNPLVNLFLEYNGSSGQETKNMAKSQNNGSINFKVTPGVGMGYVKIDNGGSMGAVGTGDYKLKGKAAYRLGFELEYIMPFNNNKWSLFIDPNYTSFSTTETQSRKFLTRTFDFEFDVDYKFLELPLGVRHYMFLNNKSKIFLDAGYAVTLGVGDSYIQQNSLISADIQKSSNVFFGVGYSYNSLSAEFRYGFNRGLLEVRDFADASYASATLIIGYKLF